MASFRVRLPLSTGRISGAQELHALHVGALPLDVSAPHVDGAGHPVAGGRDGSGDAVLTGPGLGDHSGLAHAAGQEHLPYRVVDLVSAGVGQVFALQVDSRASQALGEALGRRRAAVGLPTKSLSSAASSDWNEVEDQASSRARSSSRRGVMSVSGTKVPP